jgi:hypothetical protein
MRAIALAAVLIASGWNVCNAQQLQPADVNAIELASAEYVARTLPHGLIAFDVRWTDRTGREFARDSGRVRAITRALNASVVRADSVYHCPGDPSTCRLLVDALVRVGVPFWTSEGAGIVVDVRRRGFGRQPVSRGTDELILRKEAGSWTVVGIARRNTS